MEGAHLKQEAPAQAQAQATDGSDDLIVRLRGLPYSATVQDVLALLDDCRVLQKENGVTFTFTEDGRPSGEAFVDLCSEEDVTKALKHNNEHMGRRYVEIFRATQGEKDWDCRVESESSQGPGGMVESGERAGTGVVRLRGLPYGSTDEQVSTFFSGLSIVPGSIVIQTDDNDRETGEGFVEFTTKEDAEKALGRDRQSIGHRYIELFRSTTSEIKPIKSHRPTPYDRPSHRRGEAAGYGGYGGYGGGHRSGYERSHRSHRGGRGGYHHQPYHDDYDSYGRGAFHEDSNYGHGGYNNGRDSYGHGGYRQSDNYHSRGGGRGREMISYPPIRPSQHAREVGVGEHVVRMRGLPFSAKDSDVKDFFAPQVPIKIEIDVDDWNRPSGEGEVMFSTHADAVAAMEKNNNHMGHRYIELFLHSNEDQMPPSQPSWSNQGPPPPVGDQGQPGPPPAGGPGFQQPYQQPPPAAGYQPPPAAPQTTWSGVGY